MVDLTQFDALMQRHDMGQAYKTITASMGPSPQLVAFVNFDRVTNESLGLESFNIMDQHTAILAEIDADPAFSMATESLGDGIKNYRKLLLGGGLGLGVLVGFGPITLAMIAAGVAGIVIKANDGEVQPVKTFTELTRQFSLAYRAESLFTTAIPSTIDNNAWKDFNQNYAGGDLFEKDEEVGTARWEHDKSTVPFDKSGWDVNSFKNATKWLADNQKKIKDLHTKQAAKLDHVEKALALSEKKDGTPPIKEIGRMLKIAHSDAHESTWVLNDVEELLLKVSKHFEPKAGR